LIWARIKKIGAGLKTPAPAGLRYGPNFSTPPKNSSRPDLEGATKSRRHDARRRHRGTNDSAAGTVTPHSLLRLDPDFFRTGEEIFKLLLLELHVGPEAPYRAAAPKLPVEARRRQERVASAEVGAAG
jgi:hypothetical protein